MKKLLPIALMLLVLSACVASKDKAKMDTWIGKPESQLLATWGVPTKSIDNGDKGKILAYDRGLKNVTGQVVKKVSYQFFVSKAGIVERYLVANQ